MNLRNIIPGSFLIITSMISFSSCDDESLEPAPGDYFPLERDHQWIYLQELIPSPESDIRLFATLSFYVGEDTVYEGTTYKKFTNEGGAVEKIVRKDHSKYYERQRDGYYYNIARTFSLTGYSDEFLFLDTDKPVGGRWTILSDDSLTKTEYIVKAKNSRQSIDGKLYQNVITIEVNYYYKELESYQYWLTAIHCYAKDIGEVYNYYPPPLSMRYADSKSSLIWLNN